MLGYGGIEIMALTEMTALQGALGNSGSQAAGSGSFGERSVAPAPSRPHSYRLLYHLELFTFHKRLHVMEKEHG